MVQTNPPSLRESAQNLVAYLRQNMAVMNQELFSRLLAVEDGLRAPDNRSSTVEELHGRATKAQKKVADLEQKLADECATSDALRKRLDDANARVSAAHKTLAACLRPETQTGTLAGDAARLVKAVQDACTQILRVVQPSDGRVILERDLPHVVEDLLAHRKERDNFHVDYRGQCDRKTKAQAVEIEKLKQQIDEVERAIWMNTGDEHGTKLAMRIMRLQDMVSEKGARAVAAEREAGELRARAEKAEAEVAIGHPLLHLMLERAGVPGLEAEKIKPTDPILLVGGHCHQMTLKERIQWLLDERKKAAAELTPLREAIGLLTTLHPGMEMRADDPVGMAREIVERVGRDRANAEMEGRAIFDIGRALEGVEFGGCNSIESTVMAAREVLPKITKLRGELEKARADLAQSPGGTCWLIENPNRPAWYGGGCNSLGRWVSAIEAIRFARKEDAEAMRDMLARHGWFADADPQKYKVTEHGFYEAQISNDMYLGVKFKVTDEELSRNHYNCRCALPATDDIAAALGSKAPAEDTKPLEEVYRKATGGLVDSAMKAKLAEIGTKTGIVRDPLTGWTFDQFRRELAIARTTAQGNASMLAGALAAKGGK